MSIVRTNFFSARQVPPNLPARTKRLSFIPITGSLADAEVNDRQMLSRSIAAEVPNSWPPAHVAPPGLEAPADWTNFYLTCADGSNHSILVGFAGVKRWSLEHKTIQVGTALIPEYHGQRLGEEVVAALAQWGLSQPGISRIICDIPGDHLASAKSLERAGFSKTQESPGRDFIRFEVKTS
jgi:hypothetical protein